MNIKVFRKTIRRIYPSVFLVLIAALLSCNSKKESIVLSCSENNDLYQTLINNNISCSRYDTPKEAIEKAGEGVGVMVLASGYPETKTKVDKTLFELAQQKKLRLYVEYPSYLPGTKIGEPRRTHWERAVISSDSFSPELEKLRILAIHDCHYVPVKNVNPDIVIARVAGFDKAVYGLPDSTFPVLFETPQNAGNGKVLVSTTKLSQFISARYAPTDAWQAIWKHIFAWLLPGENAIELKWTPAVCPSYTAAEELPEDAEKEALKRGIDWYFNSRMIVSPSMKAKYDQPANDPASDAPEKNPWPLGDRVGTMPDLNDPAGDGSMGILEGFDARIFYDGTQPVRWWKRSDCNGEAAGAIGLAGVVLENSTYKKTAANIGDWLFFQSDMSQGDRANPNHPAYGLLGWNNCPNYTGTGSMNGYEVYYGDDNARTVLGMMLAAVAQQTDRYNKRLFENILGNLRISGIYGFEPNRVNQPDLVKNGWKHYFEDKNTSYAPHYQANMLACYLWAYRQTGYELFLKRAKKAIEMMMDAYPDNWKWTNGIQQERAKMLLPLAWLVQIDNKPEYRKWLQRVASDLLAKQDITGAIGEEIGGAGKGGYPPPASNEAYGTSETPLLQTNDDKVSDMLYTVSFAFLGLHEAAAATNDAFYRDAEDKLAKFLCRIQIKSEQHPELDGGWFRAFDFERWEYWASNADAGWGAWCIESGWSQSWITAVLAIRQMDSSLWDLTKNVRMDDNFDTLRKQMIPE